jgi:hypothetical protein
VLVARGDALAAGSGRHWVPSGELHDLVTPDDGGSLESDAVRAASGPRTTLDPKAPITVADPATAPLTTDPPPGPPGPQVLRPAVLSTDFPDPSIVWGDGLWYAFATNANGRNVQVSASPDLVHWMPPTDAAPERPGWARPNSTWAPMVAKVAGQWVLYVSMGNAYGGQCLDRLTSDSPGGPYRPLPFQPPLICEQTGGTGSIDPSLVLGDDGTPFLSWKAVGGEDRQLFAAPMTLDGLFFAGPPVHLLTADARWQDGGIENPSMVRIAANQWWLIYSGAFWGSDEYALGYARCASPLGPCIDASRSGPWLATRDDVPGPGGGAIALGPDGRYRLAFHAWAGGVGYRAGGQRVLHVEPLTLGSDGPSIGDNAPVGSLETAQLTPAGFTLAGWAVDPDTPASVKVHVVVNGRTIAIVPAGGERPDVAAASPMAGSKHGFHFDLDLAEGPQHVCVTMEDDVLQSTPQLGCVDVDVTAEPFGSLDQVTHSKGGGVRVAGWAIGPRTASPIAVQVTLDGRTVATALADGVRTDIGEARPAYGASHGFTVDVPGPIEPGDHELCAYAVVDDNRPAPQLGCQDAL